ITPVSGRKMLLSQIVQNFSYIVFRGNRKGVTEKLTVFFFVEYFLRRGSQCFIRIFFQESGYQFLSNKFTTSSLPTSKFQTCSPKLAATSVLCLLSSTKRVRCGSKL